MIQFIVYGLADPITGQLRYIGKSSTGLNRPKSHCYPSILKTEHTYKARWIRQLIAKGLKPDIFVIQSFQDKEFLSEAETGWIQYFKSIGHPLTNLTEGGGSLGHSKTNEEKLKISRSQGSQPFWDSKGRKWDNVAHMAQTLNLHYMAVHHALSGRQPTVDGLFLSKTGIPIQSETPKAQNARIRKSIFALKAQGFSLKSIAVAVNKTPGAVASILSKNRNK